MWYCFAIVWSVRTQQQFLIASLWKYPRDEVNDDAYENNAAGHYRLNNDKTLSNRSFEYKKKIIWITSACNKTLDTEVVPLKVFHLWWFD